MKREKFCEIVCWIQRWQKTIDDTQSKLKDILGCDVAIYESKCIEEPNFIIEKLWSQLLDEEGLDILNKFMYEDNFGMGYYQMGVDFMALNEIYDEIVEGNHFLIEK